VSVHHRVFCRSKKWSRKLRTEVLPWTLDGVRLGSKILEIGPGAGRGTEILAQHASSIVAVECDRRWIGALRSRLDCTGVRVVAGDATRLPFQNFSFSAVVSIMVLHHVSPASAQDELLREAFRVIEPGGVFVGVDGLVDKVKSRLVHHGDFVTPLDHRSLPERLSAAGYVSIRVEVGSSKFRFRAYRSWS